MNEMNRKGLINRYFILAMAIIVVVSSVFVNLTVASADQIAPVQISEKKALDGKYVPFGKIEGSSPYFGNPSDYTVYQRTRSGNVGTEREIASMTISALGFILDAYSGGQGGGLAADAINLALDLGSNSDAMYYVETVYGNKDAPQLYHKYVRRWYLDAAHQYYVDTTVSYDAFV